MCDKAELASVQENCTVKVSVVIPIYNAYDYLRPAMDSVLDQTLSDIEVICVDDGSTDHSLDILREYQKADARVRIITETNAGPALQEMQASAVQEASTLSSLMRMISLSLPCLRRCTLPLPRSSLTLLS